MEGALGGSSGPDARVTVATALAARGIGSADKSASAALELGLSSVPDGSGLRRAPPDAGGGKPGAGVALPARFRLLFSKSLLSS